MVNIIRDVVVPAKATIGKDANVTFTVEADSMGVYYVCLVNMDTKECLKYERFELIGGIPNKDDLTFVMPDTPLLKIALELWDEFPPGYAGCPIEYL